MTELHPLDPLSFPLQGKQLIEASAGTGKTYTITALYLRLLLGMGELTEKPLGPEQILVVTFTEAATEELRERIRQKIVDARTAFLDTEYNGDPLLSAIKARCSDPLQAAKLLEQAARQMDEAAIYTIHGFCQRMLKRHAFESGALFDNELTQDSQSLLQEAVEDFWRNNIYPLSPALAEQAFDCWKNPKQLMQEVQNLIGQVGIVLEPDLGHVDLVAAYSKRQHVISDFKQRWLSNRDNLFELIQKSAVNKRAYARNNLSKWLDQIQAYATSEQLEPGKKLAQVLQRFCQSTLNEKSPSGQAPQHPLFIAIDELMDSSVPVREVLFARAYAEVRQRLQHLKARLQLLTFDDLLSNLYGALEKDQSGHLARAIREQFPVALIDEFQDTDPLQYGIFSRLYVDPYNSALIMIGDPKQAIYSFRGADIFTYMQARRSAPNTYTLDTNWRSCEPMVDAVNRLFQSVDAPFIYTDDIQFQAVKAAKGEQQLQLQGSPVAAMTFWLENQDEIPNRNQYLARYAKATAAEVDHLLAAARLGERPLRGADIAILVRDRNEAYAVKQALLQYEHSCVYLSNRDSVFNSDVAQELCLLLAAIEDPLNERALKSALATELMQLDMQQLDQLNHDERLWESLLLEFSQYRDKWLQQGVLAMLTQLLHRRNLAAQIIARAEGERTLTNFLHLGELLQQASQRIEGISGLNRWLNEQVNMPARDNTEQVLRLESERNLISILTIHKSKGLEFPVVFLPFASLSKEAKSALYHNQGGANVLDLSNAKETLAKAEEERLAEDLRLLYVALTRSIYACYVGVSHVRLGQAKQSKLGNSALGHLLLSGERELSQSLETLQQQAQSICVVPPPQQGAQKDLFAMGAVAEHTLEAKEFAGAIDRNWRVSSYSALSRHSSSAVEIPGLDLEVVNERKQVEPPPAEALGVNIFSFAKGANAGTFLHSVFEEISFHRYTDQAYQEPLRNQLQLGGYAEHWLPVIQNLIRDVLQADLDGQGLTLSIIKDQDRVVEMEFMLSAEGVRVSELESLIRKHNPLSQRGAPLAFEPLQGMLKGFIDLLLRKDGRYYVLDYKSNHLGYDLEAYNTAALEQAMAEHRYDLQYLLYSLAVHRLLAQRIPSYDYERHFGGVFYLFLRGMRGGTRNGVFHCRPPKALIESLDLLFSAKESLS